MRYECTAVMAPTLSEWHRFWNEVGQPDERGCRLWRGRWITTTGGRRPVFWWRGQDVLAYRWLYGVLWGEDLTRERVIRHLCHNPLCVTPDHLKGGSQKENAADMWEAGRQQDYARRVTKQRGETHRTAKLTDAQVLEIWNLYEPRSRGRGVRALARRYGVEKSTIQSIVSREGWTHVTAGLPDHDAPDRVRVPRNEVDAAEARARGAASAHPAVTRGSGHGLAKLADDDVVAIWTAYHEGGANQGTLAAQYGVGQTTIQKIVTGQTWTHVTDTLPRPTVTRRRGRPPRPRSDHPSS